MAGGQFYAIHSDQVGRPEAVTNGAKAVVWRAQNFAFNQNVTTAGIAFNLGFPGQYYDQETGLWNNGFRDYDSKGGRYVQSDPIGLAGGVNTYTYVGNSPLNRVDPMGLACNGLGCWNTPAERGYAQAGNYSLYYQAACSGGDLYACRAGEVATNANLPGLKGFLTRQTNRNLVSSLKQNRPPMQCDEIDSYVDQQMENIRKGLALARMHSLDGATPTHPLTLPRQAFSDFHHQVFQSNGADPNTFGGDKWDAIHGAFFTNYDWCPSPSCMP